MTRKSRFIIRRRDKVIQSDDLVIDKEDLTIGRLITHDLILNHGAVSRTHAGIKEVEGVFWLFNLSRSNGTLLNGEIVDKSPLADNDEIQIGPYLLRTSYSREGFSITVNLEIGIYAPETSLSGSLTQTIQISLPGVPGQQDSMLSTATRMSGTGFVRAYLPGTSDLALDLYWSKRKREAGKIGPDSPLAPTSNRKVGKAQFFWRPTLDLRKLRRTSYFINGAIIISVLSAVAWFAYEGVFSAGELSRKHSSTTQGSRNLAINPATGSCSDCHGLTATMQKRCESCHTTASTSSLAGFDPEIYPAHEREGMSCSTCHKEHRGPDRRFGLLSYGLCYQCHNGVYKIKTDGKIGPSGTVLPLPHGGKVGYPKEGHRWTWKPLTTEQLRKRRLPETLALMRPLPASGGIRDVTNAAEQQSFDQFHAIHQLGKIRVGGARAGRGLNCGDCHSRGRLIGPGRGDGSYRDSPRGECGKCHGLDFTAEALQPVQANCNTCHQQHDRNEDLARFIGDAAKDDKKLSDYLDSLNFSGQTANAPPIASGDIFADIGGAAGLLRGEGEGRNSGLRLGGLPWYGWAAIVGLLPLLGAVVIAASSTRRRLLLATAMQNIRPRSQKPVTGRLEMSGLFNLEDLEEEEPAYPHPVIDPLLCIGCHACVEACPHDVLSIIKGIAAPVNLDQCMEDTACQIECPTSPKACVVINTTKPIPLRKAPERDQRFTTNVPGVFLIGDVSGVPLIKNAINEGGQVIRYVEEEIRREGTNPKAEYDVAIIGAGPAGLSAAIIARQRRLKYIAIEQDKVLATIQAYSKGKEILFKPETMAVTGGIPVPRLNRDIKENVLEEWINTMTRSGVVVCEDERCEAINGEDGIFTVVTQKGEDRRAAYRVRKIILAIGNRGAPKSLGVPGEQIKIMVPPRPNAGSKCYNCGGLLRREARFCPMCSAKIDRERCRNCGMPSRRGARFCRLCGLSIEEAVAEPKVKYKLSDPAHYIDKKCLVVGPGNSAVEIAVALTGFSRRADQITFKRNDPVTLIIRGDDFKSDLKLDNKINIYDCIDAGMIDVLFNTEVEEIREKEVLAVNKATGKAALILNDYVFALIGGERPTTFLESLGINITMK